MKPFKFFTQSILPLAYDDSLSYAEFLYKIKGKINEIIEKLDNSLNEITNHDKRIKKLEENVKSYSALTDKPSINGVELNGNKTSEELGLNVDLSDYRTAEEQDEIDDSKLNIYVGEEHIDEFLIVGTDGYITTKNIDYWDGGDY